MKNLLLMAFFTGLFLLKVPVSYSQEANLSSVVALDGAVMIAVSDNGMWAAGYVSDAGIHISASIWNLETFERTMLVGFSEISGAYDVSDDGNVVVGSYQNNAGYWLNGIWNELPAPIANGIGQVNAVTPDGSQMVGRVFASDYSVSYACHWVNGELMDVNHSDVDRFGENAYFNEMVSISPDGNTLLGCLNYTILPNRTAFIMINGEYFMFGDEYYNALTGGNEYNFYDFPVLSPNGKWITGDIYWVEQDFSNEYWCPFRYDIDNDITELFLNDVETASFVSDNNGNLFGAIPLNFPLRDAMVLKNGLWVSMDTEIENQYGISIVEETGYDKLGNVFGVSADGNTIIGCNGMHTYNWVLKISDPTIHVQDEPISELKAEVRGSRLLIQGRVDYVEIYDASGKNILSTKINGLPIIHVSDFSTGTYIVKMRDFKGVEKTNKIFIN